MKTISVRLTDEEKQTFDTICDNLDLSMSHIMRKLIRDFIANNTKEEADPGKEIGWSTNGKYANQNNLFKKSDVGFGGTRHSTYNEYVELERFEIYLLDIWIEWKNDPSPWWDNGG